MSGCIACGPRCTGPGETTIRRRSSACAWQPNLLVGFTDGVTEAHDPAGEELGEERVKALLLDVAGLSAEDVRARLAARIRDWMAGAEQYDDVTFVIVTVA